MKRLFLLALLFVSLIAPRALADTHVYVHIPTDGNTEPPYIYTDRNWRNDFGDYPGKQMSETALVNGIKYYHAVIHGNDHSSEIVINDGSPDRDTAVNAYSITAADGLAKSSIYMFWEKTAGANRICNSFYPTKVYIDYTDDNAGDYVWFTDAGNNSMCGDDGYDYPNWPGFKIADMPTEEVFGVQRRYYVYKHHTDQGAKLVFNDGNSDRDAATKTGEITAVNGKIYTYDHATNTATSSELTLTINPTTFPDAAVRSAVIAANNGSEILSADNLTSISSLDLSGKNITNFFGLRYINLLTDLDLSNSDFPLDNDGDIVGFTGINNTLVGINTLTIKECKVENLDLTSFTRLQKFDAKNSTGLRSVTFTTTTDGVTTGCTGLLSVDLDGDWYVGSGLRGLDKCHSLKTISLKNIGLTSADFDAANYPSATSLDVSLNSGITSLNLADLDNLQQLNCEGTSVTTLDLSEKTKLVTLICKSTSLTGLDVSDCDNLKELRCSNSPKIGTLDLSGNTPKLEKLECNKIGISALDVTNKHFLKEIYCNENSIAALDLTKNSRLEKLECKRNALDALDLSGNPALKQLQCSENPGITALSFEKNTQLELLFCDQCGITGTLDASMLTKLDNFRCYNNNISNIILPEGENLVLKHLDCHHNQIARSLDMTRFVNLEDFDCSVNAITAIDVTGLAKLKDFRCSTNELETIDLSTCTALKRFFCAYNHMVDIDIDHLTGKFDAESDADLKAQTRVRPALAHVLNDESDDDIVFEYLVEMPEGFDFTQIASIHTSGVDTKEVNGKTYFVIPSKNPPVKFRYFYTSGYTGNPESAQQLEVYIEPTYPQPKFGFIGEYYSDFNPVTEHNDYRNDLSVTIHADNMIKLSRESGGDIDRPYYLKRFQIIDVEDEDETVKEFVKYDATVATVVYRQEKIDPDGDDSETNLQYYWEAKKGDSDDEPFARLALGGEFVFTDEFFDNVNDITWRCYRYDITRDINASIFESPVYSGVIASDFNASHTLADVVADTDMANRLPLPNQATAEFLSHNGNKNLVATGTSNLQKVDSSLQFSIDAQKDADDNFVFQNAFYGMYDLDNTLATHSICGVIASTVRRTDNHEMTHVNTYGTPAVTLENYSVAVDDQYRTRRRMPKGTTYENDVYYYDYALDMELTGVPDGTDVELVGFRVWRAADIANPCHEFADFANFNKAGHMIFSNVGDHNGNLDHHIGRTSTTDSELTLNETSVTDAEGNEHFFPYTSFGWEKKDETVPADQIIVRAYYRVLPASAPGNVKPRAMAVPKYLATETTHAVDMTNSNVLTSVADVLASEIVDVRYIDLNGRYSERPFPGAMLKIVTHADGTVTKQLVK